LAHLANPLDMAGITADHFLQTSRLADHYDAAEVILISFADPVVGGVEVIKTLAAESKASIAVSYMGGGEEEIKGSLEIQKLGVPVFPSPERAIKGIAAAVNYVNFSKDEKMAPHKTALKDTAKQDAENEGKRFILEPEGIKCLRQYKIPYPDYGLAHSPEEAAEIADRLGYPIVLKVVSPDVVHKTDVQGVAIGLKDSDEVAKNFNKICGGVKRVVAGASIDCVLVCKQAPAGLDVIVGTLDDVVFGPTIMFGLGGIFTEVLGDVAFRIAPLRRFDAVEMVREIKGFQLMQGVRGKSGYDTDRLVELLMSVSRMIIEKPQITELDLNPVRLFKDGIMALDVRVFEREVLD